MANALYRKMANGDWFNQANGGGPIYFTVQPDSGGSSNWFISFSYGGTDQFFTYQVAYTSKANAQTALDTYVGQLNAGTA